MIAVLMGVSGSGKTTVGKLLAEKLGWSFADGDEFHPATNVEKMRQGVPLTDDDRRPWLRSLREYIDQRLADRRGHFMPPTLLRCQFEALEPPQDAIGVDVAPAPPIIAEEIMRALTLNGAARF